MHAVESQRVDGRWRTEEATRGQGEERSDEERRGATRSEAGLTTTSRHPITRNREVQDFVHG